MGIKGLKILVKIAVLVGLGTFFGSNAFAGIQAENAVMGVKELIRSGKISRGSVLKIVVKQGNINNYWGRNFELKKEWEERTGTFLDAQVRPQLPVLDFMKSHDDFDVTVARNREYPDLWLQGLIENLSPYFRKFDFKLSSNKKDGFILPELQAFFDNKIVAVPADNDIALMYLRKDLLEDPEMKKKYQDMHNRTLGIPGTWDEYLAQVAFFHNYKDGFYGSCEQRNPLTGWMFWMPRYASQNVNSQKLFDSNMDPLINSPAGVEATKNYLATIQYSPAEILKEGNDYSYTLPFFKRGDCYSFILTPAGAKVFNSKSSKVKSKFVTVPLPGTLNGNQLTKRTMYIYGNNLVISSKSKNKELAFLYLMWLTDPEVSAKSVGVEKGFADPFRHNHLNISSIQKIYGKETMDALAVSIDQTIFAGTGLPGDAEYMNSLNHNLILAAEGKISPEIAMQKISEEWDEITDRYGRNKQIELWRNQQKFYPSN
ncbi:ABC transporter substrate-binding protein [Desulfopila sp. IMCC35008]|uniref:ABC transporter substrate-binding protein n=1 Tax=Desulfopila sp. IMCC35008 TaxID=2653858 RepID=UPI0013D22297|nr:extracellular solute-binding protein [Desulfopila sp. IMCC35008]